jgi:Lon-like protease
MTRRTATFAFTGAILIALIAVASLLPVPYVVYSPGPMEDTLGESNGEPVIQIDGADTYPTDGVLDLTTVGVTPVDGEVDLFTALRAWVDRDRSVVPRDLVYRDDVTAEENRERNAAMLRRSQETAKVAALRRLDYEIPEVVVVDAVVEGTPADGALLPGDVLINVDGTDVGSPQDVVDAVRENSPGDSVEFVIERDGEEMVLEIVTTESEEGGHAFVGFSPTPGFELPISIDVTIDERIGGPSAGMIFAIAIYDTLTPGALLEGLHVAGTGAITGDGDIEPIGGIPQKIAAASRQGADLFLAPASNCGEVVGVRSGDMQIVSVETLDDALAAIEATANGDDADLPSCPVG